MKKIYSYFDRPKSKPVVTEGVSLTKQSFAKEADINTIVARYLKSGSLPVGDRQPQYGDFVGLDYRDIQTRVSQLNADFGLLSAELRRKFGNDPAELVEFLSDPANQDEAISLGLMPAPPSEPDAPLESPPRGDSQPPAPAPTSPAAPAKTA